MQNKFKTDDIQYRVGGLLYTPALNDGIVAKIINHEFKNLTSLRHCSRLHSKCKSRWK